MATVNFSVPDDVKKAFNKAYAQQNKSAVIADLTRDAEAIQRAYAADEVALFQPPAGLDAMWRTSVCWTSKQWTRLRLI